MIELVFRAPAIKIRLHKVEPAVELHGLALLNLHCSRCNSTLDPDLAANVSQAIWHMFLKPLAMPRDQIFGEKFDPKLTVELEKCAKRILFVPSPTFT